MNEPKEFERAKLLLTAGILNNEIEIEVYDWLRLTVPEYGTKPFNKRFETWINKQAAERFGTEVYKNWGMNGEDREYPKIRFSLTKDSYWDKFEFTFYYLGREVGYDYDTREPVLKDRANEHEKLFGIHGIEDIVKQATDIAVYRREAIEKMQGNMKYLAKLFAQRDRLRDEIKSHNEQISYVISDIARIK